MRWATRTGVHVDRAASDWLILRFIDSDAEFVFVDDHPRERVVEFGDLGPVSVGVKKCVLSQFFRSRLPA